MVEAVEAVEAVEVKGKEGVYDGTDVDTDHDGDVSYAATYDATAQTTTPICLTPRRMKTTTQ